MLDAISKWANIGNFLLGVYIAVKGAGKATRENQMKDRFSISPLAWLFLAGLVLSGYLNFRAATIEPNAAARVSELPKMESAHEPPRKGTLTPNGRIFLIPDTKMGDLREMVNASTQGSVSSENSDYIGKWIKFSGEVNYVDREENKLYIAFSGKRGDPDVDAHFAKPLPAKALLVRVGQTAQITCQISEISSRSVSLDECEFPPN